MRRLAASGRPGAVPDDDRHASFVDAWLECSAGDLAPEPLLQLLEAAFGALWACTETTLGEVTLTAIADRVLRNASETMAFLSCVRVEGGGVIECRALHESIGSVDPLHLRAGIRLVLVELLTVLGKLTGEILTPDLHAALTAVSITTTEPPAARHATGKPR